MSASDRWTVEDRTARPSLDQSLREQYLAIVAPLSRADKKEWWDRYLRGAVEFRGIPMPVLRAAVVPWFHAASEGWAAQRRIGAAVAFLSEPFGEDKLSGVLLLEELAPGLRKRELEAVADRFRAGHVTDWNTTDWLAIKVLSRRAAADSGLALHLLSWTRRDSEPLWLRRAGLISFVPLAEGRRGSIEPLIEPVLVAAARLAADPQRFAQTAVGWLLRELSRAHSDVVMRFLADHGELLSREADSMARARMEGRVGSERRRRTSRG